jgi:glycosyltransferase involved in cell wall biosynthesis
LRRSGRRPVLAVLGGHSFQDYRDYRERVLASLPGLGLRLDDDLVLLGTVADTELPAWYAAADVLAFPSTKEGWGLAVLEAMSAGLPVVASDLAVFREYLWPGRDALLVPVDDASALAAALASVLDDRPLAGRLRSAGRKVAARYSWARSAAEHQAIYTRAGWTLSGRATTAPGAAAHGSHPARNRQVRSVAPPSGGLADPASSQGHSP